ncbi:MAG: PilZ domain-containing protein [Leptospira sp.]|nr:PilZ domain-containing protein [Leptospira sp.]
MSYIEILFLFIPFIIGLGILLVKKWGWWLFLIYSVFLIIYNVQTIIFKPVFVNISALAGTLFGIGALLYFIRKDISAPYFKMYPRGWRGQVRNPIEAEIIISDQTFRTKDLSESGFFIFWTDCPFDPKQEVDIQLEIDKEKLKMKVGVVRIDKNGVGMAFRNITGEFRDKINFFVQNYEITNSKIN